MFGGLRSIPIAFAGGLVLGVVQNLVAGYSDRFLPSFLSNLSGLKSSVPFLLVIVVLLWLGREPRAARGFRRGRRATARITGPGLPTWRRRLPWALWTLALIAFSLQWFGASWLQADTYDQTVIAQSLAMAVIFLSFVVVTGMSGQVSLMQASFVTAGGFAAGWALTHDWGWNIPLVFSHGQLNFFWALVIGGLAARRARRAARVATQPVGRGELRAGDAGVGVLPRARPLLGRLDPQWRPGLDHPLTDAEHPRVELDQRLPRPPAVVDRRGRPPGEARLQPAPRADPDVPRRSSGS